MKLLLRTSILLTTILGLLLLLPQVVSAKSFTYPKYQVDIQVNKDSTVDVTETLTYKFIGSDFHGVIRQITLNNPDLTEFCISSGQTCGGFERIAVMGVFDGDGELVPSDQLEIYTEEPEDSNKEFYTVKWTIWPNGTDFSGDEDEFTWQIKYRLYGSLGWIGSDESTQVPYLYWNALPEERNGSIDIAEINIALPEGVDADADRLQVFADFSEFYDYDVSENRIKIVSEDLPASGNYTVAYELPRGAIERPASLLYNQVMPWFGMGVKLDGVDLGDISGTLENFPAGDHEIEYYKAGYESKISQINAAPSEKIVENVSLQPTPFMWLLIIGNILLNLSSFLVLPAVIFFFYNRWNSRGRDKGIPGAIIPLFSPPEGVQPYMVGALKDEKVDQEDITGTIIDLAYRGYIKIKEIEEGKNYQLTRLEGKPEMAAPNAFETELLDALFGSKTEVETKNIGSTFFLKYAKLVKHVYEELVERGYFAESPDKSRRNGVSCGVYFWGCGVFVLIFAGIGTLVAIGYPGPVLLGLALFIGGMIGMVYGYHMPAKTELGGKTLGEVLGFRMYLHHAERYRLQGLKPENFEKYLSYAVVFKLEKEWAENFKDIYKGHPDWYESDSDTFWDAYWTSRFMRSFSNSMSSSVYTPATSGKGSGWSGGSSSFGGFSGGGGGGGGSGAF